MVNIMAELYELEGQNKVKSLRIPNDALCICVTSTLYLISALFCKHFIVNITSLKNRNKLEQC